MSTTEDDSHDEERYDLPTDPREVSIARTPFQRKGNFGRWNDVYLELHDGAVVEFRTGATAKISKRYYLLASTSKTKVFDAQQLTNESLVLGLFATKDGLGTETVRVFFRAPNNDMFKLWLQALRVVTGDTSAKSRAMSTARVDAPPASLFQDPTIVADADGTILDANEPICRLLGWERDKLIGQSNKVLMPAVMHKKHDALMQRYAETGVKSFVGSFLKPRRQRGVRQDGSPIELMISLGEMGAGASRIFIATMRPAEDDFGQGDQDNNGDSSSALVKALDEKIAAANAKLRQEIREAVAAAQPAAALAAKRAAKYREKNGELKDAVADLNQKLLSLSRASAVSNCAFMMLISDDGTGSGGLTNSDDKLLELLTAAINAEIDRAADSSATTLFRGEDLNTRKISAFFLVRGAEYLQGVLAPHVERISVSGVVSDFDISGTSTVSSADRARILVAEAKKIAVAIAESSPQCPALIKKVLSHIHATVKERFFADVVNPKTIVAGFIVLRFFVPALVNPRAYGLLEQPEAEFARHARGWATLGRAIQSLANGSTFSASSSDAEAAAVVNHFLKRQRNLLAKFVDDIAG